MVKRTGTTTSGSTLKRTSPKTPKKVGAPSTAPASSVADKQQHVSSSTGLSSSDAPAPADTTTAVRLTEEQYLAKITQSSKGRKRPRAAGGADATEGDVSSSEVDPSALSSGSLDTHLLSTDAIYRILHSTHRSDVVEFSKCVLGDTECTRLAQYLQQEYTTVPLRRLKLQLGISVAQGVHRLLPSLTFHRHNLRSLDLSRNRLTADDVVTLCQSLGLSNNSTTDTKKQKIDSSLEVLDLSWNRSIGNEGARFLFHTLRNNHTIRALILKSISIDDEGAKSIAPMLCARPVPPTRHELLNHGVNGGSSSQVADKVLDHFPMSHRSSYDFFVNLNENCIGATGVMALRRDLPEYVSLTVVQQHIRVQRTKPTSE